MRVTLEKQSRMVVPRSVVAEQVRAYESALLAVQLSEAQKEIKWLRAENERLRAPLERDSITHE
jgi:hypothetical protein